VTAVVTRDAQNDPDHWVTVKVQFDHEDEAHFMVLGLGSRVEVIEPSTLRDRIRAEVAKVASRIL
jgi:predicted DNA-binding transcriptional regulator YafY